MCFLNVLWQANDKGRILESKESAAWASFSQNDHYSSPNSTTSKTQKPRFVWHVGPMKTGTTSIQGELEALRNILLEQDGWYFACQNGLFQGVKKPDFVHRFTTEMKRLRQQGLNVILSNENYSVLYREADYAQIAQALGDEWDVTIVIGYRPYYEWVPSMWSQTHKLKLREKSGRHEYPWHEQPILPMFPDYYENINKSDLFADSVVHMIQKSFSKIRMLDLYGGGDDDDNKDRSIQSRFICHILQAPTACAASRRRIEKRANQGSLEPIHANAVAFAAAELGMIDTHQWQRPVVIEALVEHLRPSIPHPTNTSGDTRDAQQLPMICPNSNDMEHLWQQTLDKEAQIFPALAQQDPHREARLRQGFDEKIVQKTYCHVDVARVLEDHKDFFKTFA